MTFSQRQSATYGATLKFRDLPRLILRPVPLFAVQPVLAYLVKSVVKRRPEIFDRLDEHKHKLYLIDPINLPFAVILRPHPQSPSLRAVRRDRVPPHDARIAGTLLTLLDMVDGRLDGDALFFTRDLIVEGDTEAVVVLRNALDDLDGSIADDVAVLGGPLGVSALAVLRGMRRQVI